MADFIRNAFNCLKSKNLKDKENTVAEGETLSQVVEIERKNEKNKKLKFKKEKKVLNKENDQACGEIISEELENADKKPKIKLNKKQIILICVASFLVFSLTVFLILWFGVFDMGARNDSKVYIDIKDDTVNISWDASENAVEYIVEYYYKDRTNLKTVTTYERQIEIEREYGKLFARVRPTGDDYKSNYWTAWYFTTLPPKEYKYNNSITPYVIKKEGKINFYLYFENLVIDEEEIKNYSLSNQIDSGSIFVTDFINELSVDFDINDDEAFNTAIENGKFYSVSFVPPEEGKTVLTITITPDFSASEELIDKFIGKSITFTVNFNWDKGTVMRAGTYILRSSDISVSNLENDIEIF